MPSSTRLPALFFAAFLASVACSTTKKVGDTPDGGTGVPPQPDAPYIQIDVPESPGKLDVSPFCLAITQTCASNAQCCSGICDPVSSICAASINKCTATGGPCLTSTECCSLACTGGFCSASACVADGQACVDSASCCSGSCSAGLCQALNPSCKTAGNPCSDNTQCCSQLCEAGVCKLGSSFCIQNGDVCSESNSCCSGDCQKAATATLGTCAPPPSGATYCSDGIDGTVCRDCNNCCSRLCAPYGPTGVRVCQPASGCRVNGDLCHKDSDCCGAAGTGLPGDGNVTCEIPTGKALGICRNPRSCNPQGNVCHYTENDYACGGSSARNNCCGALGSAGDGVCVLDSLGVPRCNGLASCVPSGGICSSTMDCCNQLPCVPDGTGLLRCYLPPGTTIDGGVPATCVPTGGHCTINADCCVGSVCITPLGSTDGICGLPTTPPGTPGVDGGSTGTIDGGAPPVCAEYGQLCTTRADCCNDIPCYNGRCIEPNIP